jgi:hypothetical protein
VHSTVYLIIRKRKMPRLFKVWNVNRTVKKAIVADDIGSLIEKGTYTNLSPPQRLT